MADISLHEPIQVDSSTRSGLLQSIAQRFDLRGKLDALERDGRSLKKLATIFAVNLGLALFFYVIVVEFVVLPSLIVSP